MNFNIVLFEPEIAPNTGNIMRLCANTGCHLILVGPLGFDLEEKKLRRAGLDYREWASVQRIDSFDQLLMQISPSATLYAFTTKASHHYHEARYQRGDYLLFGPETRGLPHFVLDAIDSDNKLKLPMVEGSRSLNLSNSVAVATYEAWRQCDFLREN